MIAGDIYDKAVLPMEAVWKYLDYLIAELDEGGSDMTYYDHQRKTMTAVPGSIVSEMYFSPDRMYIHWNSPRLKRNL